MSKNKMNKGLFEAFLALKSELQPTSDDALLHILKFFNSHTHMHAHTGMHIHTHAQQKPAESC